MKKNVTIVALAIGLMTTGCGTLGTGEGNVGGGLGAVIGAIGNGQAIGNVLSSVIGLDKVTESQLRGSWRYAEPGCAFSSEKALAKAGGEVVAVQIEEKLKPNYDKLGISQSNTYIQFNEDRSFSGKVAGKPLSGQYILDEKTGQLTLKTLLFSMNAHVKRETKGISILFESKKLLTLLQTLSALSGDQTIQTVGEISKNYDGIRIGFDMTR